jgi:ataxia telangiectasia mutated family protein
MDKIIRTCPSYKFVPLQYQIISRLGACSNQAEERLSKLITRLCSEHPYHALPQLYAIINERIEGSQLVSEQFQERNASAEKILNKVKSNPLRTADCASLKTMLEVLY